MWWAPFMFSFLMTEGLPQQSMALCHWLYGSELKGVRRQSGHGWKHWCHWSMDGLPPLCRRYRLSVQRMIMPSLAGWCYRPQGWWEPRNGIGSWISFATCWGSIEKMEWSSSFIPTVHRKSKAAPMTRIAGLRIQKGTHGPMEFGVFPKQ